MSDPTIWGTGAIPVPIPGPQGPPGPAPILVQGTAVTGSPASVTFTQTSADPLTYRVDWVIPPGETGPRGLPGDAANFTSITVNTLPPGSAATGEIGGTAPNYELTLNLPAGEQGEQGIPGEDGPSTQITSGELPPEGTVGLTGDFYIETGVANSGPVILWGPKLDDDHWIGVVQVQLTGPTGEKGDTGDEGPAGPANTLTIGTVTGGDTADATITGTAPAQVLNLVLPKGDKGDTGDTGPAGADGTDGVDGADGADGADGVVQELVAGTNVTIDATDPARPVISASGTGGDGVVESIVAGTGISVDDTDPANPVVSATGTGGEFDIMELPPGSAINAGDCLPLAQTPEIAAKFWRFNYLLNENGHGSASRQLYEIQFRQVIGLSEPFDPAVVITTPGFETTPTNAVDNNTSSRAVTGFGTGRVVAEYPDEVSIKEVAIYYASGNSNPGTFTMEYSLDGLVWEEVLSIAGYSTAGTGWQTFTFPADYTQRRLSVSQLTEHIVGDINSVLDAINGEEI